MILKKKFKKRLKKGLSGLRRIVKKGLLYVGQKEAPQRLSL